MKLKILFCVTENVPNFLIKLNKTSCLSFESKYLLSFSGAFVNNNFAYDDYKFGIEYSYNNTFFLRGGYLFSPQSTDDRPNIFQNYTLGLGLNLKEFSDVDVSLDYSYISFVIPGMGTGISGRSPNIISPGVRSSLEAFIAQSHFKALPV